MDYITLKWLHVLSSTVLFGTGIGSAFYLLFTTLSRDVRAIASVTRTVVVAGLTAVTPTTGSLAVSYKLSAPDWNKLAGGQWQAASKKFALRVTVSISDKDRTVEKQSIVPAMPEPAVAT